MATILIIVGVHICENIIFGISFFFFNLNDSIFLFITTVPTLEFRNIEERREKYFSDMFQMDHPERWRKYALARC